MHTSFATIELRRECRFQTAHAWSMEWLVCARRTNVYTGRQP
jgi:hypothetical protein